MRDYEVILLEIKSVLEKIKPEIVDEFTGILRSGARIFVLGEGRSGLMGKAFAMRLMHLGASVYAVGETITPAMKPGDVLVSISGSGTTQNVVLLSRKAKELGCPVVAVTADAESPLSATASYLVHVPAATKYRRESEPATVQPLGSLFDQCTHILLDAVCMRYAALQKQDHQEVLSRHSNLE